MIVRDELPSDIDKIWNVNSEAFETKDEAELINALRCSGCEFISLVAEIDNKVVGHILFTPVELSASKENIKISGLAPMAVLRQYQNKGIGSQLVKAGLDRCKALGYEAVVVLGHPDYYPKFGFESSVNFGIKSEYDVSDEVFMILELIPDALKNHKGVIKYNDVFSEQQ